MDDSDDKLNLRDKFALEILTSFMSFDKDKTYSSINNFIKNFDSDEKHEKDYSNYSAERLIRAAYKFADIMRKVRLSTFE